jgi:hypothetical protein
MSHNNIVSPPTRRLLWRYTLESELCTGQNPLHQFISRIRCIMFRNNPMNNTCYSTILLKQHLQEHTSGVLDVLLDFDKELNSFSAIQQAVVIG